MQTEENGDFPLPLRHMNLLDDFLFDTATLDLEVCKIIIELSLLIIENLLSPPGFLGRCCLRDSEVPAIHKGKSVPGSLWISLTRSYDQPMPAPPALT